MKRGIFALLLAFTVSMLPARVEASDFGVPSCILMESSTGKVLYEYNPDEALPPASVTKIMTLLVVMDAIDAGKLSLDEVIRVSEYAASMGGSQVYLEAGEEMSVSELIKCVVVSSANDAAVALAERVGGSEEKFVTMMNERAAALGMTKTSFKNTNGLDDTAEGHLTSARDIATMSRELINQHPEILEYSSIWMDTIRGGAFGLTNTNRLIRFYRGANGLKTGSTSKAKFCISATAERDGTQLIAVIMAAESRDARNEAAKKLLDYGFANWEAVHLEPEELEPIEVIGSAEGLVSVSYPELSVVVEKGGASRIERVIELPERLSAPIEAFCEVGRVEYRLDGEVIGEAVIRSDSAVERIGFGGILARLLGKLLLVG